MTSPRERLNALIGKILEDHLDEPEQAEFARILRDDPAARREYREMLRTHAALRFEFDAELGKNLLAAFQAPALPAESLPAEGLPAAETALRRSPLLGFLKHLPAAIQPVQHPVRFLATTAVLTSLFWGLLMWNVWPRDGGAPAGVAQRDRPPIPFIARLTHAEEVVWNEGAERFRPGAYLAVGQRLELTSGRLHILFGDGARVAVEGPATLRIDSRKGLTLAAGRALARVEGMVAKHGFRVETPHAELIDLGTEFGVEVRKGEMEVHVFEGKVEVLRIDDPRDRGRRLAAGEAVVFGNSPQQGFYVKEKKMNRAIYLSLAAVLTLPVAEANVAQGAPIPAMTFTNGSYTNVFGPYSLGYEFTPNVDIWVTHLGYYDRDGNGLVAAAEVGIFQVGGSNPLVTSTTVPTGTGGLLVGDGPQGSYRYQALTTPVPLTAGTAYRVAGVTALNGNGYIQSAYIDLAFAAEITPGPGYYADDSGSLVFPTTENAFHYAAGSFLFTLPPAPVPEPASGAVLGLGGLMLWSTLRRRRNR